MGSRMWGNRSWASYVIGLEADLTFRGAKTIGKLAVTEHVPTVWLIAAEVWVSVPLSYVVWPLSVSIFSLSSLMRNLPPNL